MAENTLRKEMLLQFLSLLINSNFLNMCVCVVIYKIYVCWSAWFCKLREDKLCLDVCFLWVFEADEFCKFWGL